MVLTVLEGSRAAAEAVRLCRPDVVAAYPITPQTHIVQELANMSADGSLKSKHIEVESEFSAISAATGASAAGSRSYTATCSQGLALMHEVLFATAGMRLPVVMTVVNRALSAPINIWNDHQDSISQRDAGWIQLYAETNQEIIDLTIQAFKIAEDKKVLLPIMVCMDGFFLSHTIEPADMPEQKKVDKFLPKYRPDHAYLDPKRPMTQGPFAFPKPYAHMRKDLSDAIDNSKDIIQKVSKDFKKSFGRQAGDGLIEQYNLKGKKTAIITMGSLGGTVKEASDKKGDFGLLRIISFRPFPKDDIIKALKGIDTVIVIEKNISLGASNGAVFDEVRSALYSEKNRPKIIGYVAGIGGTEVTVDDIIKAVEKSKKKKDGDVSWIMEKE
ncbi:MAG: pyruvate ferredoxin oxidoreductase [Candidatus Aenigmarchaeota archaeon]|nr:pyruvate ferredoxin oxidoreductase [Candidatus Aenigmarchaeota archaeon]